MFHSKILSSRCTLLFRIKMISICSSKISLLFIDHWWTPISPKGLVEYFSLQINFQKNSFYSLVSSASFQFIYNQRRAKMLIRNSLRCNKLNHWSKNTNLSMLQLNLNFSAHSCFMSMIICYWLISYQMPLYSAVKQIRLVLLSILSRIKVSSICKNKNEFRIHNWERSVRSKKKKTRRMGKSSKSRRPFRSVYPSRFLFVFV